MIQYQTQRLSVRFFLLMLVLLLVQVALGVVLSLQQADPSLLSGTLNFNITRSQHVNLGVLWILSGFIGTLLFVGPILAKRELVAPWLIRLLFIALIGVTVWNAIAIYFAQQGIAGWWLGQPWIQEGLEYLEAGRIADVLILIAFVVIALVIVRTFPHYKTWNEIHWGLAIGVTALAAMWVFGMFFVGRIDLQEYFRWFVVHYWVEGVWEVIHISLIGILLVLMFKADVKAVGYAVFWGVTLVWLSGLLGNAHHYFWVGTPEFWQFWGSLFSALEPLPLILCFWHMYLDAHHDRKPLVNKPAFFFLLGSAVLEMVGAGILGFTMTFALTNVWSHGTWVTPSHAHLAMFGTFGMLGLGAAYWIVPAIRGVKDFDQRFGQLSFWLVFLGMLGIAFAFAIGGTVQVFLYRTLGLDWFGGDLYPQMMTYKVLLVLFGLVFLSGVLLLVFDLYTLGHRVRQAAPTEALATYTPPATGWSRPLSGFEAGVWLLSMWVFGFVITLGLLSFNLPRVQLGDPTLPYIAAGVGYPGLLIVTLLFVWRFLASLQAREAVSEAPMTRVAAAHAAD